MMKLELLLFLMIAAGAVGTACGADGGPEPMPAGAGGSGSTSTGTSAANTAVQTGVGATGTGSASTTGSGGSDGGGGYPADCAATATCGNFGGGCIKCAAKTACVAEYEACFDDAPCKAYSLCIEPCGAKELDCLQQCQNTYPSGATEYQALTRCVICGDCVTLCEHAPDICN